MCGIFGYVGSKNNAAQIVLEGLKQLEYRGYDSWGVAAVINYEKNKTILVKKRAGKIGDATVEDMPESSLAFGHTRWATHGGVSRVNAHPHLDCLGEIAVAHNGIFENYEEIRDNVLLKNHRYVSQTDSEVIAHSIEEYIQDGIPFIQAVQKTFHTMSGLNAIIAIHRAERVIVAIRNGSPLVVGFGKGENYLASDASALLPLTREVYFLDDNEMAIVEANRIQFLNVKTGKSFQPKKQTLRWEMKQTQKGAYPFYMTKEIYEQPGIVSDIAKNKSQQIKKIIDRIEKARDLYLIGCGSAYYASLAGTYLFSRIAKKKASSIVGSEFGYQLEFLNNKDLILAVSQSGETMDILESVKKAKLKDAKMLALVNVLGSTLYREADYNILIGAGPEKSVASTKALVGMISHLIQLAFALAGREHEGTDVLLSAVRSVHAVLTEVNVRKINKLAQQLNQKEHIYIIGRGLSYIASLETAMKIKEISYIHAEGMAAGELKHGSLALVSEGTPCIVFIPNDETYGANLAGAMEMKARGGYIIGVSHKPHELFDYYLPVKDAGVATIIPNIVTGQMLAYQLTMERGLDPDMPRNLAKSVTVK